jgi:hypothetical protein
MVEHLRVSDYRAIRVSVYSGENLRSMLHIFYRFHSGIHPLEGGYIQMFLEDFLSVLREYMDFGSE